MKRSRSRFDPLTTASIGFLCIAVVLAFGLVQSDRTNLTSFCLGGLKQEKTIIAGHKKPAARRLICDHRVIVLKDDAVIPNVPENVFRRREVVACSYDIVTNPFGLLSEQVDTDTLWCTSGADVG